MTYVTRDHHHSQGEEQSYHPQKFPRAHLSSLPPASTCITRSPGSPWSPFDRSARCLGPGSERVSDRVLVLEEYWRPKAKSQLIPAASGAGTVIAKQMPDPPPAGLFRPGCRKPRAEACSRAGRCRQHSGGIHSLSCVRSVPHSTQHRAGPIVSAQ